MRSTASKNGSAKSPGMPKIWRAPWACRASRRTPAMVGSTRKRLSMVSPGATSSASLAAARRYPMMQIKAARFGPQSRNQTTRKPGGNMGRILALGLAIFAPCLAIAAETVNVYSIWPENWARPMFEEFEKATGIKVNFIRFSSGEALARVMAEKNNPRIDVLFGGPVETFAAGVK